MAELHEGPELAELAGPLIEKHFPHLLEQCTVAFLFLDAKTAMELGKVKRVGEDVKLLTEDAPDFIIAVWHDWWQDATDEQQTGLLMHLLCHCGWSVEKERTYLEPHNFEGFRQELEVAGIWSPELADAQLRLEVEEDEADDDDDDTTFEVSMHGGPAVKTSAKELERAVGQLVSS